MKLSKLKKLKKSKVAAEPMEPDVNINEAVREIMFFASQKGY